MRSCRADGSSSGIEPLDLSVIIVSFNTRDLLAQCLKSLTSGDLRVRYEILVVDNGSKDGSAEMVGLRFPDVILVRNAENLGFAKANNQAFAIARGRYLLLLNSDTVAQGDAIVALVAFLEIHPKAAVVGPRILNFDATLQSKGYQAPSIRLMLWSLTTRVLPFKTRRVIAPQCFWHDDEVVQVGWLSGCCLLVRRAAVQTIGGLCEDFVFYGEETEWCYRARKAGFEVWYFGQRMIRHLGGGSTVEPIPEALRLENYKTLCRRTVGIAKAVAMSSVALAARVFVLLHACLATRDRKRRSNLFVQLRYEAKVIRHLLSKTTSRSEATRENPPDKHHATPT